jgi:hypothetical protein
LKNLFSKYWTSNLSRTVYSSCNMF